MNKVIKSISFNVTNEEEYLMLEFLGKESNVSDYIKKLILKDVGEKLKSYEMQEIKSNAKEKIDHKTKHGLSRTRFYRIWFMMVKRCLNENDPGFCYYGGRGIKVDELWADNFINFKNDMYESYLTHSEIHGENNTTIDRINNDGNYELGNCRWATYQVQANNKRKRGRRKKQP